MPVDLFAVKAAVLDGPALERAVVAAHGADAGRTGAPGVGAVSAFVGLVRDQNLGRRVLHLDYEAYEPLAVRAFERIAAEAVVHWPSIRLGTHHRTGPVAIGEASIVI